MFRYGRLKDDRLARTKRLNRVFRTSVAVLAIVAHAGLINAVSAEEGLPNRPPATENAPQTAPGIPESGRQLDGAPGATDESEGFEIPDLSPGCPFRDRPLNLLV